METKREKKIAVVFDTSGSCEGQIVPFSLGRYLEEIHLKMGEQFDSSCIKRLLEKYEHVFVITDDYGKQDMGPYSWDLLFDRRLHIINISELLR